jgi:hypothetical protein
VFTLANPCCVFQPIVAYQNGQPTSFSVAVSLFSADGSSVIIHELFGGADGIVYPLASGGSIYYDYGSDTFNFAAAGNASYYVFGYGKISAYLTGQGCPVPPSGSCTYPQPVLSIPGPMAYYVALSPDGTKVAAGNPGHDYTTGAIPSTASIYGFPSGNLLGSFLLPYQYVGLVSVGFSADSQSLVTTDNLIHVLNANNATLSFDISNNWSPLYSGGFSGNGTETVSAPSDGGDGTVAVRNVSDGSLVSLIDVGAGYYAGSDSAALSNDGQTLAASLFVSASGSGTTLYNVSTGTPISVLNNHWGQVAFLPDGQTLVSGNVFATNISFYNYQTGATTGSIAASQPFSITPNGSLIAAWVPGPGTYVPAIFQLSDFSQVATFNPQFAGLGPIAISPDGSKVAVANNPGSGSPSLELYTINGTLLFNLTGNAGLLNAVAFSPDGGTVAAADTTGALLIFSVATGQLMQTYNQETGIPGSNIYGGGNIYVFGYGGVLSIAYSPDGTTIYWTRNDATSVLVENPFYEPFLTTLTAPAAIVGGDKGKGTVTLTAAAPTGGIVVDLTGTGVTVPAKVTVPAGSTTANFSLSTSLVASNQTASITATTGGVPKTATLTVEPLLVKSVSLGARSVTGGKPITGNEVHMDGTAPEATQVTLTSSNPTVASVPASVTVAKGSAASPAFTITTTAVKTKTVVTISASYDGSTSSVQVTVAR